MNNILFVSELLNEIFPVECETVGPTNLQDISEGEVSFTSAENGSYMDLGSAIAILVGAATFIKTTIEIYTIFKKELGRKPEKDEIEIKIAANNAITKQMDNATRARLIKAIIRKLENEK